MLYKFSNLNKHGDTRTRIISIPQGKALSYNPKGLGLYQNVSAFKYDYKHPLLPPTLLKMNGKTYVMPMWKEVVAGTTLNDIKWVKPEVKKTVVEEFQFASSSSSLLYTTKKFTKPSGEIKYSCTCPGVWRSKDRKCKHIKSLIDG